MCSRAKIPAETVNVFASCSLIQHRAMFAVALSLGEMAIVQKKFLVESPHGEVSDEELISLCTADLPGILITIFQLIMVYERKAIYICISNSFKCGCYTSHSC